MGADRMSALLEVITVESPQFYLSEVLNTQISNTSGELLGRLRDLAVTPGEEFPVVSELLFRRSGKIFSVSWDRVVLLNPAAICVSSSIEDLESYREKADEIHAKRDLLDKQVIDLEKAKLVRVNDVRLVCHKHALCLTFVDAGFRGLLRRMGYERFWENFQKEIPGREIVWDFVWHLETNAARLMAARAGAQIGKMQPKDLARIISRIPRQSIQPVLNSLDDETLGKAIYELEPKLRNRVAGALGG
jgi:magnesium transporter